jgi:hypothetical protein
VLTLDWDKPSGGVDDPYRVRYYDNVMDLKRWNQLVDTFPPDELLRPVAAGYKNSLGSSKRTKPLFDDYLAQYPRWNDFYQWVVGNFARMTSEVLNIPNRGKVKFEFSGLPGDGGSIEPHPDTAKKVGTAVMFFTRDWKPEYGAGFEVLRHKTDPNRDWTNIRCPWNEVETVLTIPPAPARILWMKRTNNSLHGVRPFQAPFTRRTITINLINDAKD